MPKPRRIPPGTRIPIPPEPPTPIAPAPKGHIAIAEMRKSLEASLATIATEREQARSMVEQGQQLIQQGDTGLKQLSGAEIEAKKQLAMLDAAEKAAA